MSDKPNRISLPTADSTPEVPPQGPAAPTIDESTDTGINLNEAEREEVKDSALAAMKTCYDPELPVNIYELGLIYSIEVFPNGLIHVDMTLTSPACPVAGSLPGEVRSKLKNLPRVAEARVNLVWNPPWTQERMSEAARLELGLFG
jgi:FeS assembly SUF system protein